MFGFVVRRLVSTIPTLFGIALITFVLMNVVGGDPVWQMVGKHATPQIVAELRHQLGTDQPLPTQFLAFLKQIVTFDYGTSYATKRPISQMIAEGIEPSLSITVPGLVITTIVGVLIGLLVAYYRGRWIDKMVMFLCVVGMSISVLAYILFGQYFLAYSWGLFPIHGYETGFPDRIQYVALPILILFIVGLGYDVRFYRTAVLEEVNQDYVRTARAKGLSDPKVFLKHVLKNAMVPILTNVVLEIPLLILGSFLLESFFGVPGLGNITIDAINASDFPVIRAMTMLTSILYVFGNLATDIMYAIFDPRVSLK
jgi:peptide/nickel transport system permease protein